MRGWDPAGEQRGQAALSAILAFAIVSTGLHYSHNFVELDSYPGAGGADGIRPAILLSWPLLTAVGLAGYRLYLRRRFGPAYACLLAYAWLGLTTPAHFLDGSPDIAPFWYATIFTDALAGLAIVAFTGWSALTRFGRYRSRRAKATRAPAPSRTR
ncbi:MAG: hypothetical protein ACRDLY_03365 [Thermoleophilaceae bacterium]